jgi:hypothetical protein
MAYRGCHIFETRCTDGAFRFVWEDEVYGSESDDAFDTAEQAKSDIDRYFGHGAAPRVINGEIYHG